MTDVEDFEPPPIDPETCLEGTVPGWLNANGLPTSCVGDLPLVEPLPEREVGNPIPPLLPEPFDGEIGVPVTVYPQGPQELAETGPFDPLLVVVFAVILVLAGVATVVTRWKSGGY